MLDGMSGKQQLDETARDFLAHRPHRTRDGRKVAGIAAGIGARYGVDPVVVRVALVVTTLFGGAGVLVYLLAWLFLPEEGDEVSAFESMINRGHSSTSTTVTVILCLALIPASSWFFGGTWFFGGHFSGFLGLAMLLAGLYLLHKNRDGRQEQVPAAAEPATVATGGGTATPAGADTGSDTTSEPRTTPPAWDPLGAAPFAWDLPDPSPVPAPEPTRRRKSKVGLLTVGAALVAVGVCVGVSMLTAGWMTPAHAIGIVLGVVALGLVGGAFAHGGRGLIGLAVPLALAGIVLTNAPSGPHPFSGGMGDRNYAPTTVAAVKPHYDLTAGDTKLDLRKLPNHGTVTTTVNETFGDTTVLVPRNADVRVTCSASAGELDCLGRHADGLGANVVKSDDGADGPGGLTINLDVSTRAGDVVVRRG
jgi:phage shock protein PspC (stress-responsive transcriptional regulator)